MQDARSKGLGTSEDMRYVVFRREGSGEMGRYIDRGEKEKNREGKIRIIMIWL